MILPFQCQEFPPPRRQENRIRPLELGNPLWNISNLILFQPMHSASKMEAHSGTKNIIYTNIKSKWPSADIKFQRP